MIMLRCNEDGRQYGSETSFTSNGHMGCDISGGHEDDKDIDWLLLAVEEILEPHLSKWLIAKKTNPSQAAFYNFDLWTTMIPALISHDNKRLRRPTPTLLQVTVSIFVSSLDSRYTSIRRRPERLFEDRLQHQDRVGSQGSVDVSTAI